MHNLTIGESGLYALAAMLEDMSVYDLPGELEEFAALVKARRDAATEKALRRLERGLDG